MSEEKLVDDKKPRFENPLTRKEMIAIGCLAVAVAGASWADSTVLTNQEKELEALRVQQSGMARAEQAKDIEDQIKRAKMLRAQTKAWEALLPKIEAYFPAETAQSHFTYIDLLAAISKVYQSKVVSSNEAEPVVLEFTADPVAESATSTEGEEELELEDPEAESSGTSLQAATEDVIPTDLLVKYKEYNYKIKILTTYFGWLRILHRIENSGKFYRLKNVIVREPPRTDETGTPLDTAAGAPGASPAKTQASYSIQVEAEIAAYSFVETGQPVADTGF